tara:strand:+ start:4827 stop:5126 length:300 start_codon:yes stop_codon:yes gene_type:complete
MDFKALEVKEIKDPCKGLIFSGYSQVFWSNGRVEHKQGFRMLKRASCKGCEKCRGLLDYFIECIGEDAHLGHKEICNYSCYELTCDYDGEFNFVKIKRK